MSQLVVERRGQEDRTAHIGPAMLTPPVGDDYWSHRVRLSESQAVVAFPKFSTIGVGFAIEDDWNTNLPWTCDADAIWQHIAHNKGDEAIDDATCIEAIRLIQEAIRADGANANWRES